MKAHLLESQLIRESCSPYASPIVLVKKKDGSLWMCVDYRQLNSKARKDAFSLPRIGESLDALTGPLVLHNGSGQQLRKFVYLNLTRWRKSDGGGTWRSAFLTK